MNDKKGGESRSMSDDGEARSPDDRSDRMRGGGGEIDYRMKSNSKSKNGIREELDFDYMRHTPGGYIEGRSPVRATPSGERIKYSEVELNEATPEAFRAFLHKWRIFEKEYQVAWDRTMIHREVIGFLDLRWREYINESCKFPAQIRVTTWVTVQGDRFEEFILWVAEAVEGETSTGGSSAQRTINAIQRNQVEIDSHSGGLRLEIQWGKLNTFFSVLDIRNVT